MSDYELAFGRDDFLRERGWKPWDDYWWKHAKHGDALYSRDQAFEMERDEAIE